MIGELEIGDGVNMHPSFLASREIGNNLGQAFKKSRDENAIESILSQAMDTGNPEVIQNSIGKILSQVSPERQGPAIQYLQNAYQNVERKKQQEQKMAQDQQAAQAAGYTYGVPPQVAAQQVKDSAKQQRLSQYGLGGDPRSQYNLPNAEDGTPLQLSGIQGQQQQGSQESPFRRMSDDQLVSMTGAPDREISEPAKQELRRRQEERSAKKPGDQFASIREKAVAEYVDKAISSGEEAENLRFSIDQARKALQGNITGPGLMAIAKNNPYTQLLVGLNPDESLLQATNKKLLEGTKGIFGSKPTEREIFLLLNSMLPSIGKTKEANLAGLNFIERVNEMKLMHSELVSELTNGGTKYVSDLERQVNSKIRPYAESLKKDLSEAKEAIDELENSKKDDKKNSSKGKLKSGEIKVRAPNGKTGFMTQEQIDKAKAENVIFTPI